MISLYQGQRKPPDQIPTIKRVELVLKLQPMQKNRDTRRRLSRMIWINPMSQ